MMTRKERIAQTLRLLEDAQKSQDAWEYAHECIHEEWAAGCFDDCADVYYRASEALDRIAAGGKARR